MNGAPLYLESWSKNECLMFLKFRYIDYPEINFEEKLGTGGFGEVHKATWKGTEVAVKVYYSSYLIDTHNFHVIIILFFEKTLIVEEVTKEMRSKFMDEMQLMSKLRHPNVVLFMGACKYPSLCLVMEYMSLGSLYGVWDSLCLLTKYCLRLLINGVEFRYFTMSSSLTFHSH